MAVKNTKLGGTDWVDGEVLYSEDLNDTFDSSLNRIHEIYTGADFDTSTGSGSDEESYELTAIGAGRINSYVKVKIMGDCKGAPDGSAGRYGKVELKIQTKETDGAYSDALAYTQIFKVTSQGDTVDTNSVVDFEYLITPTAGEITNGMQIQVFSKSSASTSSNASFTNIQTIIQLL